MNKFLEAFKSPWVTYLGALLAFFAVLSGVFNWIDPNIAWSLAGFFGFSSVSSLRLFMSEKFGLTQWAAVLGLFTSVALFFQWITVEQYTLLQSTWGMLTGVGLQKANPAAIKMLLLPLLFLWSVNAYAQEVPEEQPSKIVPEVLLGFSKFTLDGDYALNVGGAAIGAKYDGVNFEPGLYIYSKIFKDDNTEKTEVSLDAVAHISVWNKFGFGFGVEFWQSGVGIVEKVEKSNTYIVLTYNLEL